jgi:hypothetical protein
MNYPDRTDRYCMLNGCQYRGLSELADGAQQLLHQAAEERKIAMSGALWCDLGEHAFSSRDRKRTTYSIQTLDEETGQPVNDQLTACGPHAAERKAMLAPKAALPAGPPKGADQELYTEFLEWKNGIKPVPGTVE